MRQQNPLHLRGDEVDDDADAGAQDTSVGDLLGDLGPFSAPRITTRRRYNLPVTSEKLRLAIAGFRLREAWFIYRMLPMPAGLSHDEHSAMLVFLTKQPLPSVAQNQAPTVIAKMREDGHDLDIRNYHSLLTIYLANLNEDKMLETMQQMAKRSRAKPTRSGSEKSQIDGAARHHGHLRIDVTSFNLLMMLYARLGKLEKLMQTWVQCIEMHPASRYVNMDAWAIMIDAYARKGDTQGAMRLYQALKSKLDEMPHLKVPSAIHSAVIRMHGFRKDLDAVVSYFESIRAGSSPAATDTMIDGDSSFVPESIARLQPDQYVYDAIIEACEAAGDLPRAEQYWAELLELCSSWELAGRGQVAVSWRATPPELDSWRRLKISSQDLEILKGAVTTTARSNTQMYFMSRNRTRQRAALQSAFGPDVPFVCDGRPGTYPLQSTFTRMIRMYARAGLRDKAHATLAMTARTASPERLAVEEVVMMNIRLGDNVLALALYDLLTLRGFRPSIKTASAVALIPAQ
nr:hypothetical protein HK105_005415 [Polyrhizophydium stewartii]